MKNIKKRGLLASAGALLTAAALTLSGSAAALAAPALPTSSNIVITKLSTPPNGPGSAANGLAHDAATNPILPTGTQPIAGVKFEAYAVPLPGTPAVGSNAWQQAIGNMTVAGAQSAVGTSPAVVHTFGDTDGSGITRWDGAPRGLYLIREISAPNGVTKAGDFLVAVPMTDPNDRDKWLDTIYVYPKNSRVTISKTVNEGDSVAVGQNITWTVNGQIPRDAVISKYELVDSLDDRLTYVPTAAVSLTGTGVPTLVACTAANVPADCDYDLVYTAAAAPAKAEVKLVFTPHGRSALVTAWKADATAQVKLDIITTINSAAKNPANTAAAAINNTATLFVNDAEPVASGPAIVKVGDIKITKKDSETKAALTGAKFSVYLTEDDAKARQNPITIDGQSVFEVTAANGELVISGLLFSNYVNGAQVANSADYRGYWVNEVEAPNGYQLLAAPIPTPVTNAGSDATNVEVLNVSTTGGFVLPLTGGMGTAILTVGGIAILAIVLLVARRRRETEASAE